MGPQAVKEPCREQWGYVCEKAVTVEASLSTAPQEINEWDSADLARITDLC